jgi:alpha-beta hydrolase superfamily lysophospholipase
MPIVRLLLAAALASALSAQSCQRPTPPPTGFTLRIDPIVLVTYSDAYQSFGTMTMPDGPAPGCGWPLVVHVHPLGASRSDDVPLQAMIAGQGYAVWSYDVRGQGQAATANTAHPNPGTTLWGPVERCDLAEQIQFVAASPLWTGLVDAARCAVIGSSQGGVHAWNAAAWSGLPLAVPGRAASVFPTIACVVANDYVAEPIADWVRGGMLFSSWFVEMLAGSYASVVFEPGFVQTCRNAFLGQDPQSLIAAFAAEGRAIDSALLSTTVPVLYSHAYHDQIDSPLATLRLMQGMTAPRRAMLSTVGHNTPLNRHERAFRDGVILRWLHRFLWSEANEVELELPFVLAEVPLERSVRENPDYAWSRHHGGDPLVAAAPMRLFLHDDFALRESAPPAPQAPAVVAQTIDPMATTFDPTNYLADPNLRRVASVLAACPLQELVYSTTVAAEMQIDAAAAVHLRVQPGSTDWMLAALLTVQGPMPSDEEVMLASAAAASSTSVVGVPEDVDFHLPPIAARLPAGSTVRLRLRNHWLRESPMARALEVAPRFHPFQVDILHGDATGGSWIDLPAHPVTPRFVSTTTWFDLATALPLPLELRAGSSRAGNPYFVTASLGGHLPGTPFLNDALPIESDWFFGIVTPAILLPQFQGFLGNLDANGNATAVLDLSPHAPLPAMFAGLRLSFAAFVFDGMTGASGAASNPCDVFLR